MSYIVEHLRGLPKSLVLKNLPARAEATGDEGLNPGSGRPSVRGNGNLLQYACQDNPMDRVAWWTTVPRPQRVRHD